MLAFIQSHKKHILIVGLLVACALVFTYVRSSRQSSYVAPFRNERGQVEAVVEKFGEHMKNVPLSADSDTVADTIQKEYAPYITEALLDRWIKDPLHAPGRETSSPWPERIEISSMEKIGEYYEVVAKVISLTSVEKAQGGYYDSSPAYITVANTNGAWRVAEFQTSME